MLLGQTLLNILANVSEIYIVDGYDIVGSSINKDNYYHIKTAEASSRGGYRVFLEEIKTVEPYNKEFLEEKKDGDTFIETNNDNELTENQSNEEFKSSIGMELNEGEVVDGSKQE